ncbi:hypothetical protein [Polyangium aurulentum]|uniref:hypothetical protein n=1 Tax=Polyangium aurulentum TaxID=2567896 RepID=UPI0011353E92|nr:hypothetical protein [Polyangium aurulentum]UQA55840.1 hypothetical protein E8A73_031500 [Polyangium aurulentum]
MLKQAMALVLCSMGLFGCAAESGDLVDDVGEGEIFTETIVVFDRDGKETVYTRELDRERAMRPVTPGVEIDESGSEERVGEASQALVYNASCDVNALWIYSQSGYTGSRICFLNNSTDSSYVDLSTYCRVKTTSCYPGTGCETICLGYWDRWVGSFSAGSYGGAFIKSGGEAYWFAVWEAQGWPSHPAITDAKYVYTPAM